MARNIPNRVKPLNGRSWPKTRAEAIRTGSRRYRNNSDCARGHKNPLRFTSTGACVDCHYEDRRPGGKYYEMQKDYVRKSQNKRRSAYRAARDEAEGVS